MKKIKFPKSLLVKFSCVLLVLGVAIMTFGFMKGPSSYIYYMNGIKTGNTLQEKAISKTTEPFNEIKIDCFYQNVEIKNGDDYSVAINSKTPYITPDFSVENGVLKIGYVAQNEENRISANITPNTYEQQIIVTVPDNTELTSIDISFDTENAYKRSANYNLMGMHTENYVELKNLSVKNLEYRYPIASLKTDGCNIENLNLHQNSSANFKNSSIDNFVYDYSRNFKFYNCKLKNVVTNMKSDSFSGVINFLSTEIETANVKCETLYAKDSSFVNLSYETLSGAKFEMCSFENVNGVSADETTMSVKGNFDDYSLNLTIEDSAEIVTKIVDYTDPYYQLGYDTEETLAMGTVKVFENKQTDVYERLYNSSSYIESGARNENADEVENFIVVNGKREVKYFIENERVYFVTNSDTTGAMDIENYNTITLSEIEEHFSDAVIKVNSEKYYNGNYQSKSKSDSKKSISLISKNDNVEVTFS